jgi:hypothetical protein
MSMQSLVSLAEIVNALAVTATLVVLVVSIRQNTRAQRVLSVETLTAAIVAINVPAMESPALGSALASATKDWHAASRDERILAHYFFFSYFKLIETAWYQKNAGTLDPGHWVGWENGMLNIFHTPGVREGWWPYRSFAYSPAFQKYLSESAPPGASKTFADPFAETEHHRRPGSSS